MSRPWIAFFAGDYLKDTGHLTTELHGAYMLLLMHCWQHGRIPAGDDQRAALSKMTLARWKKVKHIVEPFFEPDGTQKRATKEIEKAETIGIKRSMAGRAGGLRSGISRSINIGSRLQPITNQTRSKTEANVQANTKQTTEQKPSNCEATHKDNIKSNTECVSLSEASAVDNNTARSLATALPMGALAREPETEPKAKAPHEFSRSELDALLANRRKPAVATTPSAPVDDLAIPEFLKREAS